MKGLNRLQLLIHQITTVRKEYAKVRQLTGEDFNIFDILGLTTSEVRGHSAFLGEMLNPKGSHCNKELYLDLFVTLLNIDDFNCKNAILQIEKSIGPISEDKSDGGQIDIVIIDKNNNHAIIIENKINAGDGENQLFRYYNYSERNFAKTHLLYLTLDGRDPSAISLNIENYGKALICNKKRDHSHV